LRNLKLEYFTFFVGFDEIIASMELIFYYRFPIFTPQRLCIRFLRLFRIHIPNHLLPFHNGIPFSLVRIDEYHNAAFPTHHIPQQILEIGFILMFIKEINDFFLQ
jgi:hypothetical protein